MRQRYWPRFPWRRLARHCDVFLPMAYWTFHASGRRSVAAYTAAAIREVRARTGRRAVPVHVIGGIAHDAPVAEVGGFVAAAGRAGAFGASLYDAPMTSPAQWHVLRRLGR